MRFRFRICPTCDQPISPNHCFCDHCFGLLQREIFKTPEGPILQGRHRIRPLMIWGPTSPLFVRRLMYSLKGGAFPHVFVWLARSYLSKWLPESENRILLYPPSGRGGWRKNHAGLWAQELSRLLPESLSFAPFSPTGLGSQKSKRLAERRAGKNIELAKMRIRKQRGLHPTYQTVFCDDIYSSGETAKACLKAFGKGEAVTDAWCIAYRDRLRPMKSGITP